MRKKISCEICGLKKKSILHYHHIIPQLDERCHNGINNIAILCPTCHSVVHTGEIIIIGLYPTTDGLKLFFFKNGEDPPIEEKFWLIKENPLVITLNGEDED